MSTIKEITSKNSINSNPPSDKNIQRESKEVQKNISGVNLSSSKLVQKQSLTDQENHPNASEKQINSKLNVEVSLKNVQENVSDLQSSRKSQLMKSTLLQKTHQKSAEKHEDHMQKSNVSEFSQFDCEDQQFKSYFSHLNTYSAQKNPIYDHQKHMFETLKKQLSNGKLLIQQERPFRLKKREQKSRLQQEREIKYRLQQKRQQALMKIKEIQQQQLQLKRRAFSTHERPRKHAQLAISKITQSIDKQQVKRAIQQYKRFTQQIQRREQQVQLQHQQQHHLQLQKQQQLMRIHRQFRRQQVKKNLKQIVQRQRVRKSIIQQWKAKEKQLKNKRYLYIENKQKQKKHQEIKQMQHQQVLDRIRKNHEFDREDLERHQKKYQQLLQERREMSRSLVSSAVSQSRKKYQTSKFHQVVVKEMEEQKKKELEKLMKVKENQHKEKIHKYQQKLDNEIKPNLHYKKFVPIPRAMSLQALQPKDRWNVGLKYLQKAKKLKMPQTQLKLLITKRQEQDKLKLSRQTKEYKDYLQQIKKDIKYDPTEKKLDEILKNKRSYSNYQILKDAKYMSEYLVEKSKHSDQQKTMLAIKKKMDILNAIY